MDLARRPLEVGGLRLDPEAPPEPFLLTWRTGEEAGHQTSAGGEAVLLDGLRVVVVVRWGQLGAAEGMMALLEAEVPFWELQARETLLCVVVVWAGAPERDEDRCF
mmetsp:Transcript_5232/g.12700  ORF Transcript_5232/g.12700 Transcript_5232/m.12700 type:complete len:106 (+) Transcript_5232:610-927(+)